MNGTGPADASRDGLALRVWRGAMRLLAVPLVWLVQLYRLTLSPFVGQHCRFTPTCSQYAIEALQVHGAIRGSLLTAHRLGRCHPWCEGGYDPVPPASVSRPPDDGPPG